MQVLFVSSEIYPLAKTGGLADVSAALPMALAELGVEMRLLMPGYPQAVASACHKSVEAEFTDFGGTGRARLIAGYMPDTGLPVWLVESPTLFDRPGGLYQDERGVDWPDNAQRFAFFSHVAARLASGGLVSRWRPDLVHANDWHTGLLPLFLRAMGVRDAPSTLFTIHNMAFQGCFPASVFSSLGLPTDVFTTDGLEFFGGISFLKAGIRYASHLTTVSPSYAREILQPDEGRGLDGLLRSRATDLTGILNGVDYRLWNPARDPYLPSSFSETDLTGKQKCKVALQQALGLVPLPNTPLIIYVSRITDQKMADVVVDALPAILERGIQFVVHGRGDPVLESRFRAARRQWPRRLSVRIGYDESLAHRLHAGADMLLQPSRFEPCGLSQLYAMRYGTLPIVRGVGGLADTVVDADDQTLLSGTATGFVFHEPSEEAMLAAIDRALVLYQKPAVWRRLQLRALREDFGWHASALEYLALYRRLAPDAAAIDDSIPLRNMLSGVA